MIIVVLHGRIPGIIVQLEFPEDEVTPEDLIRLTMQYQEALDKFNSVEEFNASIEAAAKRIGVQLGRIH
jgi:hypothetical protein